jgi:dihydrofolate synthase/folylpolyglutamate synthase
VAAALAVCHWLGLLPQDRRLDKLLSGLNLAGRLQRVEAGGRVWLLDVGHNPAAARYLIQHKALQRVSRLVFGMVHDKDVSATLKVFEPHFKHWYFATPNAHGREANAEELQCLIANTHESQAFASVKDAMQCALDESRHGDTILVAGSFYTVGDALNWLATIS